MECNEYLMVLARLFLEPRPFMADKTLDTTIDPEREILRSLPAIGPRLEIRPLEIKISLALNLPGTRMRERKDWLMFSV